MLRAARCVWLLLLLAPAGCTRDEDYLEVFREQLAANKEMADILATVKDQKSMADAKLTLEERRPRFEAIARKGKALPNPPPPEVVKRMKDEEFAVKRTMSYLQAELDRVGRLEGGKEFLQQFKSGVSESFSRGAMMTPLRLLTLFLVLALTGCTDNVDSVCREYRAANNECIDAMMMVTSEYQAERMTVRIFKPMKDRYAEIDRKLKIVKANRDKEEMVKECFESDGLQLYVTDLQINVQRFALELTRLKNLRRQLIDRERELLGDPKADVNPADVCPKLDALISTPGVLDTLDKQLFEPELLRMMVEFPNWKVKGYDEMFMKFAKRRAIFLPAKNIALVQ